ncbi:hypothetical protein NEOC65_001184 [Neochlamydia sp. AcF65]|nr:hypothetical protein [Neochlamydia sp. AcF65]MBS4170181.1 hypothetical protein [Neochlamydia sp. AcF95]
MKKRKAKPREGYSLDEKRKDALKVIQGLERDDKAR